MIDPSSEILIWYVWATFILGGLTTLGLLIWFMIWAWDHTFSAILIMFKVKKLFVQFITDYYREKKMRKKSE